MGVKHGIGRLALGAAAALSLTLPFAPAASAYTPGTSPDFFGVNASYLRNLAYPDQPALLTRMDEAAASMQRAGISWARLMFDQSVEERSRDVYDWTVPDLMEAALARHGVRGQAMFIGTAAWDQEPGTLFQLNQCGMRAYPYDYQAWTDWTAAAARRYGPNGTFWAAHPELPQLPITTWEIGNEPNLSIFWCPKANPEAYAQTYDAATAKIQAVDPNAKVIVGGLAPNWNTPRSQDVDVTDFLARMVAWDPSLPSRIPEVGVHPYTRTSDGLNGVLDMLVRFRQTLTDVGMATTPMVANEYGWYTQPASGLYYTTEDQRAALIGGTANAFWRTNCGVAGMAPYAWITAEINKNDPENWYGLASTWTGDPHPSGAAYAQQIQLALGQAASPPPTDTLALCPTSGGSGGTGGTGGSGGTGGTGGSGGGTSPPPSNPVSGIIQNLLQANPATQSATSAGVKKNCRRHKHRRRCHRHR